MANGINTVKAADNGLTAITTAVESLKATVTQARQDASWKASSFSVALTSVAATDVLTISGGAVTGIGQRRRRQLAGGPHVGLQLREHGLQQRRHLRRRR